MPPVFGPVSPSHSRLWSRAAGKAIARDPSQIAMTLASYPWSRSSMTRAGASAGRPARNEGTSSIACSADSVTMTPLPPARPSALRTASAPPASSSSTKACASAACPPRERPGPCGPDPGLRRDLVAERLRGLEPGRLPIRAEDRDARLPEGIGDAGRQRRLRSDHHELRGVLPRQGDDRARIQRIDARDPDVGLGRDPGAPGRDQHLVDAGLAAQLPGERVLAAATADDEDAGGHHEGHRGDLT